MNSALMESTNCNLCGIDDFELYLRQKDCRYSETPRDVFQLVKCKRCDLIYLNTRPTREYLQEFYPDNFYEPRKLQDKDKKRKLLKSLAAKYNMRALIKRRARIGWFDDV